MLIKRTRRQLSAAAVLVAVFAFLPGPSRAATTYCINAYGQTAPSGVFCDTGFKGTVKPTDSLTGQTSVAHFIYNNAAGKLGGPNKGDLRVRGIGPAGTDVRVTVTDGVRSMWRVVTTTAANDDASGVPAGAFEFTFGPGMFVDSTTGMPVNNPGGANNNKCVGCVWMPGVSDLGRHTASGSSPNTVDPANLGPSTLTVAATWSGGSVSTTATKYAAATKDSFAPSIGGNCHDNDDASNAPFFSPCVPPSSWFHRDSLLGGSSQNPEAVMSGFTWDDAGGSFGHGSEIADIILTVKQGSDEIQRQSIINGRQGPVARWRYVANINDYEPNCVDWLGILCGDAYRFEVEVIDAWGNSTTHSSGDVYIYPS